MNSNGANRFFVNPIRTTSVVGNALYWDSTTSEIIAATSSLRYKTNITDLQRDSAVLHQFRPREYDGKFEPGHFVGFIAEELYDIDPYCAVIRNDTQLPESINWNTIIVYLVNEVKKLRAEVDALKQSNNN